MVVLVNLYVSEKKTSDEGEYELQTVNAEKIVRLKPIEISGVETQCTKIVLEGSATDLYSLWERSSVHVEIQEEMFEIAREDEKMRHDAKQERIKFRRKYRTELRTPPDRAG